MAIPFKGFLLDSLGAAVASATVELFDRNTTTPVRASTTTDSNGFFSISHATEGQFDIRITSGSDVVWRKYDTAAQMQEAEFNLLSIRGSDDAFKYVITPAAIAAERVLNLPLLTGTAAFYVTPAIEDLNLAGFNIDDGGVIFLKEQAEADADVADSGQIWVDTQTPNKLFFTDDAGTDFELGTAPSQADQAALEAETNEDTYAPPDLIKHSPGVAKVWVHWEQDGAHGIIASYNMTSVTDGGAAGDTDHLYNVDFSGNDVYALVGMAGQAGKAITISANTDVAGGVTSLTFVTDTLGGNDLSNNYLAAFGDQ